MPVLSTASYPDRLQTVPVASAGKSGLEAYRGIISDELYQEIQTLATPLTGARIVLLNATAFGGGVAEMFPAFITILQSLGITAEWLVMPPHDPFFAVTKNIHNALQGKGVPLTSADREEYLRHNAITGELLRRHPADLYEIHDPQPAGVRQYLGKQPAIWRCHIDTSTPDSPTWEFLHPLIAQYDRAIFTMPEFVPPGVEANKVEIIQPAIDPFNPKNRPLAKETALPFLREYGIDTDRPLITQISRYDPWKDPKGVVEAYRLVKSEVPGVQLALVGSMASDDPEGPAILEEMREFVGDDPDVHLIVATAPNEFQVNVFQIASEVIVQKSLREGFGLTVTEAMWKGQPVIGGNIGGIRAQITDGVSGFLVNNVEECAQRMLYLLRHPSERQKMGKEAAGSVRNRYLLARLVRDHLRLYRTLL